MAVLPESWEAERTNDGTVTVKLKRSGWWPLKVKLTPDDARKLGSQLMRLGRV